MQRTVTEKTAKAVKGKKQVEEPILVAKKAVAVKKQTTIDMKKAQVTTKITKQIPKTKAIKKPAKKVAAKKTARPAVKSAKKPVVQAKRAKK